MGLVVAVPSGNAAVAVELNLSASSIAIPLKRVGELIKTVFSKNKGICSPYSGLASIKAAEELYCPGAVSSQSSPCIRPNDQVSSMPSNPLLKSSCHKISLSRSEADLSKFCDIPCKGRKSVTKARGRKIFITGYSLDSR